MTKLAGTQLFAALDPLRNKTLALSCGTTPRRYRRMSITRGRARPAISGQAARKDEARRIAANIAKWPTLLRKRN